MSISMIGVMVGLPIALAVRAVMGKEAFEEWVNSTDYPLYTNFSSMEEMTKTVKASGYDVEEWLGSPKTHLNRQPSSYFLWKIRENRIVAVMSVFDSKTDIENFVKAVEKTAKKDIFVQYKKQESHLEQQDQNKRTKSAPQIKTQFPTVYVDERILEDILEQYQIPVLNSQENRIVCRYKEYEMTFFRQSEQEPFDLKIVSSTQNMKQLYSWINTINDEYFSHIQEQTYFKIKEEIKEEGMEIEEETVLEDDSIVLTVTLD